MDLRILLISFALLITASSVAQQPMTLKECIGLGIENNLTLQQQRGDIRKAQESVRETRAELLPQIEGYVNASDYFKPSTSITYSPAYDSYNVTEMLQYNASAGLQLSMPLYNQTRLTQQKVMKLLADIESLRYDQAREELIVQIASLYYLGQVNNRQLELLDGNIRRMSDLREMAQAFYDNEMVLEVDVQRVDLNLEDLRVQRDNTVSRLGNTLATLRYVIVKDDDIALAPLEEDASDVSVGLSGVSPYLPELQILEQQITMGERQQKLEKQAYIPKLNLTGSLSASWFAPDASDWFHDTQFKHTYGSYGIGLQLQVPIWDSFRKRSRIRQARIDLENTRTRMEDTRMSLQADYSNAQRNFNNAKRVCQRQQDNLALAENVYEVTVTRYREGMASMTDVLQDEMRITDAQSSLIEAYYNLRISALTLLRLTGQLDTLL